MIFYYLYFLYLVFIILVYFFLSLLYIMLLNFSNFACLTNTRPWAQVESNSDHGDVSASHHLVNPSHNQNGFSSQQFADLTYSSVSIVCGTTCFPHQYSTRRQTQLTWFCAWCSTPTHKAFTVCISLDRYLYRSICRRDNCKFLPMLLATWEDATKILKTWKLYE